MQQQQEVEEMEVIHHLVVKQELQIQVVVEEQRHQDHQQDYQVGQE